MIDEIELPKGRRLLVVRDDLHPGGTKARVIPSMLEPGREYCYATPAFGCAQIALALSAKERGARATIFCAKRKEPHARTQRAIEAGARLIEVPNGYMTVVAARARAYCAQSGAELLPFGLDCRAMQEGIAELARALKLKPLEVWSCAGSGTLSRALQSAWPEARFRAVSIGARANTGRAVQLKAPEKFEQSAQEAPPFPSCSNYDAKAWRFILQHARDGALFWNVAAD